MAKVIALTRVSTDGQGAEGRAGLPAQRAEIERVAARETLEIVEWVELRGVSGAKVVEDPAFQDVLGRLVEPEVAGVVVADFDRLFRRGRFSDYAILDAFADTGSAIYTAAGPVNPAEDADGLMSVIQGEIGGMERRSIRDRTMRAKESIRREGRLASGPQTLPFAVGYEDGRWFYRPAESEIVREVFQRFDAGERNLAAIGRAVGVKRPQVRRILTQPLYKGIRRIDERKIGNRYVKRAPEAVIERQVMERPLIDPETWDRVQVELAGRRRAARAQGTSPAVYHGLTRCTACGGPVYTMRNSALKVGWQYACGGERCFSARYTVVDEIVDDGVAEELARPDVLEQLLVASVEDQAAGGSVHESETIERELKALRDERERVVIAYERGLRTAEEADRRCREIDGSRTRLDRLLEEQRRSAAPAESPVELAARLAAPFAEWRFLSTAQKRRIVKAGVEAVWLSKPAHLSRRVVLDAIDLRLGELHPANDPHSPTRIVWSHSLTVPFGDAR